MKDVISMTTIWVANNENNGKKEKSFKAETIKTVTKLKCLEFKYFSVFHGPSILPALTNLASICAALHQKLICLRCILGGILSYVLSVVMT